MTNSNKVLSVPLICFKDRVEYWSKVPGWRIAEATALLLNFDPDQEHLESDVSFRDLKRILTRAKSMKALHSPMKPTFCLKWAVSNDITVPDSLREAVFDQAPIQNWRRISVRLRRQLARVEAIHTPPEMEARVKSTALKLLLGMAEIHYRIRPSGREFNIKKIVDDLTFNIKPVVSEKTIRDWLHEAQEKHSEDFEPQGIIRDPRD